MDDNSVYIKLFDLIKNHKWKEFTTLLTSNDDIDINIRDDQNNYLITYAVTFNKKDIIKLLLERDAKIDIVDLDERSLLYIPIKYNYIDVLKLLLETNKNNIGISIIDMRDRNHKIPLHHAINMKNIDAVKLLLEYGSNPLTSDKNGYTALHHAVYTRMPEMCALLIKYVANPDTRCDTGETALHMSCNLQLVAISELLIKSGANVNLQDFEHEFTPLHYTITFNNKELTKILIEAGADPNVQDVFGNTPLHYAINENSSGSISLLLESAETKNVINLNLWNIDGKIHLHLLLEHERSNIRDEIMTIILNGSNLSIQDNEGNTCLHYLLRDDLWKESYHILKNKKLDIIIQNKEGVRPIDIVNKRDLEHLIDLTTDSYLHRLKRANTSWSDEWESICSKEFDESDKDKLVPYFNEDITTNEKLQSVCRRTIRKKIVKIIKDVKDGKVLTQKDMTYPIRREQMCINLSLDRDVSICTFTGSTLDVLIGLVYLLKKHSTSCGTLSSDFAENKDLCRFYRSLGIIMNTRCEFLNFEIVWVHQKLYLIEGFYDRFRKCMDSPKKRFIIVPLGIEMRMGSHANYLVFDSETNSVERFEPHGSTIPPGLNYNPNLLDDLLETRFKTIDTRIRYVRPKEFLPKISFQQMDVYESKKRKIGDPGGFCALWGIWYVDMRLTYNSLSNVDLVKLLIRTMKKQNISVRNMIRNYAQNVIEIRDRILQNANMDINDWLNDQYTDVQIDTVLFELKDEISKLIA